MGGENSNQTDKPRFVGEWVRLGELVSIKTGKLDANAADEDGIYPFFTCAENTLRINTAAYDCECVLVAGNGDLNVKYYNGKFNAYQRTYIIEVLDRRVLDPFYLYQFLKSYVQTLREQSIGGVIKYIKLCNFQRTYIIEVLDRRVLDPFYLYQFLKSYVQTLREQSIGGVIKYIKLCNLKDALIPLPDVQIQQNIVGEFEKMDLVLEKQSDLSSHLDALVKSRFVEMFGASDLSLQKSAWHPIKQLGQVVSGATPKTSIGKYWDGGIKWITPAELSDMSGWVYDSTRHITEEGLNSCGARMMPVGTVILSSRAPIGKMALLGDSMCCNQGFKNIVCGNRVIPEYLYYLLGFNTAYLNSLGRGATFKELSKRSVEEIKIPVPSIKAQGEFVAVTQQVDKLRFAIQEQIEKLETLKASLMQEYFG